ncbi:replication stress response regulator SDE2 isoform X2 [Telopea speciosissima]|uniref:replication stress response regulator SDE2 isoform X1 n=1 Tax=Telopea speciosissima TaxID=54955 RepID=UPI001CC52653|nr:replication stress response regulator SDE2 isoform X1 [Telopea speciosissima]XP_043715813.1 replication stress response regulator SDE2 isoform X2 [Telopea speciosissima]
MAVFQLFVSLLDGKSVDLKFPLPTISGETLKAHLYDLTSIPPQHQRLCTGCRNIREETLIVASEDGFFPSVHLLLRLIGGKGGFGSLLRGAATKAGQKKTNNFDACRDMSGRRLRHVNAEKKLEEWKAEAEERKLEKIAEDFLKKQAKAAKKSGSGESEKYIEKYREDSAKCREEVEAAVRQAFSFHESSKRKITTDNGPESKRVKIWMGKRTFDESDSDEENEAESEDDDDEKSVILNDGNSSGRSKEGDGNSSSDSVSDGQPEGESSGGDYTESNLEEENDVAADRKGFELGEAPGSEAIHPEEEVFVELEFGISKETIVPRPDISDLEVAVSGSEGVHAEGTDSLEPDTDNREEVGQATSITGMGEGKGSEGGALAAELCDSVELKSENHEMVVDDASISDMEKPLNFKEFNSAAEMEVLGMERLKMELQKHGLKCGGTLQERAARLFLLKTTPVEMLPKKLLAKK